LAQGQPQFQHNRKRTWATSKRCCVSRRAYFKDDAVQLAYRRALGGPEAPEPALRPSAAIELEIKQLEQRMKSDRRGWFKDERAQARYRTNSRNEM